jgi:hypothetical protein
MAISTNGTVLARVAGALYNTQMSNATYAEVASLDPSALANTLYARDFSTSTDAAVATTLVTNLGLTSVTGLANWVAAQLTAAGSAKGAKVVELLNGFAQMTADTTYGAYATAFNTKVDAALALSQTVGNKGGTFAAAGVVVPTAPANATFALTAGIDAISGGAGNDTITATPTTLTAADTINGGDGTDTLSITGALTAALPAGVTLTSVERVTAVSTSTIGTNSSATASSATVTLVVPNSVGASTSATLSVGGVTAIYATLTDQATATAAAAAAIKSALQAQGYTVATSGSASSTTVTVINNHSTTAGQIVVTGLTSGAALPQISATTATDAAKLPSIAVAAGRAAASPVAYDISSSTNYAGVTDFTGTSDGGANVKVSKTTNATMVNTTGGAVNLDGGKAVAITTTGTSAVGVTSKGATTVSVTGGTGATIDNVEDSTAATTSIGTSMTAVTLTSVNGDSAVKGAALASLTIGGATTAARTVTITNAVVNHSLNIIAAGTGYDSTGATENQTVVTDAAVRYVTLTSNGTKNSVDLVNNTAMTNLTINGSGALKAGVASASLIAIDASSATGNLTLGSLHANTKTVTTGSGNDSFTTATTTTQTVNAGAGNDSVTLGAAVAAGSTINLGSGNDKLLSSSGSVASGFNSVSGLASTIDGGDGTDGLAVSLVTSGNAARFTNFETLILDNTSGSVDATLVSGITGLELASAGGGTYTGLTPAQSLTVTNTSANTAATTLTFSSTSVVGTADSYSISFNAATPTGTTAEPTSANVLAATIAASGIESFNINSNGSAYTWNSITMGTDANARTVSITGAKNLDITFPASGTSYFGSTSGTIATGGGVSLIDGSAATGKLAINIGTGLTPAAVGLTVKGGVNNDTITSSTGALTIYGDGGNDTFNLASTVYGSGGVFATIADGVQAGDVIDLAGTQGAAGTLGAAQNVASATSLAAALEIANGSTVVHGVGTPAVSLVWFQYGGNTYIYSDLLDSSTDSGTLDALDSVVKIVGLFDLSSSTFTTGSTITIV